ncbi:Transcriptional regulator, AraC family [Modestobacter italicus]|uniref:Transcriptional regulator, AraC family n=1 Tax=Modestobacter italicus (strain DSM 44449 / CECT 9708 / BC 501) TaxID=2732864 RepID=I4F1G1_MODI5|nr:helix-turn-helix domain-containing protein [Modestobacter marinus]CCH89474.1 Transcriptional regulator, AraC family [Modestobacter marinus]
MLILDTAAVPLADRVEAFDAAMHQASVPCRVEQRTAPDELHAEMHLWSLGPGAVFTTRASPFRLVRTPRHVRLGGHWALAVSFQAQGRGEYAQLGHEQLVHGSQLMVVDMSAPYSFGCAVGGEARSFQLPYESLELAPDVVRRATPRLRASPLHGLVLAHLQRLCATVDDIAAQPGAAAVGAATVELVRALVVSAAGDVPGRAQVREQTLLTRVRVYADQRLTDPGLTPESIAAAHAVSVRQLYKVFAAAGISLEQWLIERRLAAAHAHLASPAGRRRTIAAVAHAHGFTDASHFSRRFAAAYGMTPRDYQRTH